MTNDITGLAGWHNAESRDSLNIRHLTHGRLCTLTGSTPRRLDSIRAPRAPSVYTSALIISRKRRLVRWSSASLCSNGQTRALNSSAKHSMKASWRAEFLESAGRALICQFIRRDQSRHKRRSRARRSADIHPDYPGTIASPGCHGCCHALSRKKALPLRIEP